MINNDSVITAYDEHLTLVEWLQKVEKLLANGGLKSTALNDKGNATFSLTLTFNDNTTITSPDMTLTSVNEALTALTNDIDNLKKYKGHDLITYDKTNCVRVFENETSLDENTLKGESKVVTDEEAIIIDTLIKKAIKYGFVIFKYSNSIYDIMPLVSVRMYTDQLKAIFGAPSVNSNEGHGVVISLNYSTKQYDCSEEEI